jgi:hypothetical protein
MHDEKRGERYFSMHILTGAELTKLIDVKLYSGMRDSDNCCPGIETTAHTKPIFKTCQAGSSASGKAKLSEGSG